MWMFNESFNSLCQSVHTDNFLGPKRPKRPSSALRSSIYGKFFWIHDVMTMEGLTGIMLVLLFVGTCIETVHNACVDKTKIESCAKYSGLARGLANLQKNST